MGKWEYADKSVAFPSLMSEYGIFRYNGLETQSPTVRSTQSLERLKTYFIDAS
jgi:hypothetical protein